MSLHSETGDPGSFSSLNVVDELDDAAALFRVALVVVVVVKLYRSGSILVGKLESVDDELVASIYFPPTGFRTVRVIGKLVSALLRIGTVCRGSVAYRFVYNVKTVEKVLILALIARIVSEHRLDVPLETLIHLILGNIVLGLVISFMEEPLGRLGMPYENVAPDLDLVLGILLIPLYKLIEHRIRP